MLYIGDKIFYPGYGAGIVINIEEKEIHGNVRKYYIIKLLNEIVTMVPVDTRESKGIRKCIDEFECKKVFEVFKEPCFNMPSKWLDRYKVYTKTIKDGDIFAMCSVLNSILEIKKDKKISKSEEKFFEDLLDMVSQEVSIVLNISINKIKMSIISGEELISSI